jgi:hypothetical protein
MTSVSRLAWALLGLALLGATASLFGPPDPWWGLDVGSTGTALFGFSLWAGAWFLAKHPDRVFSSEWPIAERRAWAGLLFVLLVSLNFFRFMWELGQHDAPQSIGEMPTRHFIFNIFTLLISWAVVSKTIGTDPANTVDFDERDRRIQRAADRAGDLAFTLIAICCIVLLMAVPAQRLAWWLAPLIAAQLLIGMLILKSLSQYLYLVVSYVRERV